MAEKIFKIENDFKRKKNIELINNMFLLDEPSDIEKMLAVLPEEPFLTLLPP